MRKLGWTAVSVVALAAVVAAQGAHPRGKASIALGGGQVEIDYGRPALKGRTLDALLQGLSAERIWRAGENQVTTLMSEADLMIGGKRVPAGKYSLYVHIPSAGDWSLIVNSDLGIALSKIWSGAPPNLANEPWPYLEDYQQNIGAKEMVRAKLTKGSTGSAVESFTIELAPAGSDAKLTLSWGDQSWSTIISRAS